jgi:hypothetical protein
MQVVVHSGDGTVTVEWWIKVGGDGRRRMIKVRVWGVRFFTVWL